MEYMRTDEQQFCDVETYMVLDTVTGEAVRFGESGKSVGSLEDALRRVSEATMHWNYRLIIIKLAGIQGFRLIQGEQP